MTPDPKGRSADFHNPLFYTGAVLALVIFVVECFLFGLDFLTKGSNIYLGIITYILLPPFLILGLVLMLVGALRRKERLQGKEAAGKFQIDLTKPSHRNTAVAFIIGGTLLIIMTVIGSYKAFNYTESVQFCGVTCHGVMTPQYTAYLHSPHARVKCVECHVGSGPEWYIRYKLNGARQMFHFLKGDYPRPIPTPVHNLRPPTDTCQHCHWPKNFYGAVELNRTYYSSSAEQKDPWVVRMLMRVGGTNRRDGIHAHMNIDNDIYYAAEDEQLQKITWVKSVSKNGGENIFVTEDSKFKDTPPPPEAVKKMDCLDCHNRPSHHFNAPYALVNNALNLGDVSAGIPNIKAKMMEWISGDYATADAAADEIPKKAGAYYQKAYPDYYRDHRQEIEEAAAQAVAMYRANVFPEMKTRWDNRPDNIGHLWSPGCFRCHDGAHADAQGRTITRDCAACHTIIEQGPAGAVTGNTKGVEFIHPFDDDGMWKEMNCSDCHSGN